MFRERFVFHDASGLSLYLFTSELLPKSTVGKYTVWLTTICYRHDAEKIR